MEQFVFDKLSLNDPVLRLTKDLLALGVNGRLLKGLICLKNSNTKPFSY